MRLLSAYFLLLAALMVLAPPLAPGALAQAMDAAELERQIKDLKNDSWQIRWYAVTALGEAKDPRAVEALIGNLKDENSYVRATSAWALGEIKDRRAMDALIAALGEESHGVRKNSLLALKKITGQDLGEDPAAWQEWWDKNK